jgi:hypothetical protein
MLELGSGKHVRLLDYTRLLRSELMLSVLINLHVPCDVGVIYV